MPATQTTETSTNVTLTVGSTADSFETILGYIETARAVSGDANERRLDARDAGEREAAYQDRDKADAYVYWNRLVLAEIGDAMKVVSFG